MRVDPEGFKQEHINRWNHFHDQERFLMHKLFESKNKNNRELEKMIKGTIKMKDRFKKMIDKIGDK